MGTNHAECASADVLPAPLEGLMALAEAHKHPLAYAGEVTPRDAWDYLAAHGGLLVDVRTLPEWQFTGTPDINGTPANIATISWKIYPQFQTNPQFAGQLAEAGATPEMPLFFLCRSGGRSLDAAVAMTAAGYRYCFNITGGFEGEPDARGHRGTATGWKAAQLPWIQG